MRVLRLLFLLTLASCGASSSSGACEQVGTGGERFCHNFRDTQFEQGATICARLKGSWSGGSSCDSLGYTKSCTDGSFVKPAGSCA